jgi:hypothetical protein
MDRPKMFRTAAFIFVVVIYIAARYWNVTFSCLWFDEIFSVNAAEHSWNSILKFVALDLIHPPLFYVVLKLWIAIGGEGLLWLRTLPIAFSVLSIFPFVWLCRELRIVSWTTILALFLVAVNGSVIKYAQEVRMYSMLMFFALVSMSLFASYFRKGKGTVALTIVNIVLVYVHYFGWLVVASEVIAILALQRIKWRAMAAMFAATALAFTPWLVEVIPAAASGSQLGQNIGWMQRPGLLSVLQLLLNLVEPFYYPATSVDPISVYRSSIPLLLIICITFAACFFDRNNLDKDQRTATAILVIFLAVPLVTAFAASWVLPYSVWGTRHLIIAFAPFALLVAASLSHLPKPSMRISALTLIICFSGYGFAVEAMRIRQPPVWCGFETIAKLLQADEAGPVYVFEDLAAYHLWFEFDRNRTTQTDLPTVIKVDNFPGMYEDKAYFIPRGLDDEHLRSGTPPLDSRPAQIWVVYRAARLDITAPPLDTLSDHGFLIERQDVYDGGDSKIIALFHEKK